MKRIKLTHGTVRVSEDISKETIDALNHLVDLAYKHEAKKCTTQRVMPSLLSLNFREMRKTKGLTLREVEETTGISNAYLSQLETGKIKSPGYETVKLLYDLYSNEA